MAADSLAGKKINENVCQSTSDCGIPVKKIYTLNDIDDLDYYKDLGDPGTYPYTRGIYPEMYSKRLWTVRQYSGYGQGEDTNKRFIFLLNHGQTGLSVASDLPTQMGLDSDDPRAFGEVARVGVAIDTLADMESLFKDISLGEVSTSFTINATANIILAMYVGVAEQQGVPINQIRGTVQNDLLKEFMARGTYIFPPKASIKLVGDIMEWCNLNAPHFNAISVGAGHIHQAGATLPQCWAVVFENAQVYMEEMIDRGYNVDQVASVISFLSLADSDFFESIAMYRAARRIWARLSREKYSAKEPRSMKLRMATDIECRTMTRQQPLNNIARIAIGALSNVLGGCQSMLLPCYDEAFAIPSEDAVRVSVMIQHIIAEETGVTKVVDPLAGSYYVESLTNECEKAILDEMKNLEERGGVVALIEKGEIQRQLARQAFEREQKIQRGELVVVGLNKYRIDEEVGAYEAEMFKYDENVFNRQLERLAKIKADRDNEKVAITLAAIEDVAKQGKNTIPATIEAVKAYATVGEIVKALEKVYGRWQAPTQIF